MAEANAGEDQVVELDSTQTNHATSEQGGQKNQSSVRTFSQSELDNIVKKTKEREKAKHATELEAVKKGLTPKKDADPEHDYKTRFEQVASELSEVRNQMQETRNRELRATVANKLNEFGCIDSDLLTESLISRNIVHYDSKGNLLVESDSGDLDDLLRNELNKRPHLQKPVNKGGAGSSAPGNIGTKFTETSAKTKFASQEEAHEAFKNMSKDEIMANLTATYGGKSNDSIWDRKKK